MIGPIFGKKLPFLVAVRGSVIHQSRESFRSNATETTLILKVEFNTIFKTSFTSSPTTIFTYVTDARSENIILK